MYVLFIISRINSKFSKKLTYSNGEISFQFSLCISDNLPYTFSEKWTFIAFSFSFPSNSLLNDGSDFLELLEE